MDTKHTGSNRLRRNRLHRVRGCGRNLAGVAVPTMELIWHGGVISRIPVHPHGMKQRCSCVTVSQDLGLQQHKGLRLSTDGKGQQVAGFAQEGQAKQAQMQKYHLVRVGFLEQAAWVQWTKAYNNLGAHKVDRPTRLVTSMLS